VRLSAAHGFPCRGREWKGQRRGIPSRDRLVAIEREIISSLCR
jgi:hypothetical protein